MRNKRKQTVIPLTERQAYSIIRKILNGEMPPCAVLKCDNTVFRNKRSIDIFLAMRTIYFAKKADTISADLVMRHLQSEILLKGDGRIIEECRQMLTQIQTSTSRNRNDHDRQHNITNPK